MSEQNTSSTTENTKEHHDKGPAPTKEDLIAWIKAHKRQLIIAGVCIPVLIGGVICLRNQDSIEALWKKLIKSIREPAKFSGEWFKSVPDEVLNAEREKVRIQYCHSGGNGDLSIRSEKLLRLFDKELSERAWGDDIPHAPVRFREHGMYLPNDE